MILNAEVLSCRKILHPNIHIFKAVEDVTIIRESAPVGVAELMEGSVHSKGQRRSKSVTGIDPLIHKLVLKLQQKMLHKAMRPMFI